MIGNPMLTNLEQTIEALKIGARVTHMNTGNHGLPLVEGRQDALAQ